MAATIYKLWHDAALTTPIDNTNPLELEDGVAKAIYAGSATTGYVHERASDPGVAQLQVSIVDAAGGSGLEAANVRLALSEAGIAAATPGAALNLGVSQQSGVANAIAVWVQIDDTLGVVANYTEISLAVLDVQDTAL
jgi:hypothetical protein